MAKESDANLDRFELYDKYEGAGMRSLAQVNYNRSLPYEEFLKSLYWQHVRRSIFRRFRLSVIGVVCEYCGLKDRMVPLDIHHRTYEHQGDELNHLGDLIVLCRKCHEKQHENGTVNQQRVTNPVETQIPMHYRALKALNGSDPVKFLVRNREGEAYAKRFWHGIFQDFPDLQQLFPLYAEPLGPYKPSTLSPEERKRHREELLALLGGGA